MMGISCGKYRGTYLTNYNRYKYQYNHLSGGKLHLFLGSQLLGSKPLDKSVRNRCRSVAIFFESQGPVVGWKLPSITGQVAKLNWPQSTRIHPIFWSVPLKFGTKQQEKTSEQSWKKTWKIRPRSSLITAFLHQNNRFQMRTLAGSKGPAAPLCIVKKWVLEICVCVSLSTNIYIDMYIHMYAHMCVCDVCMCVCVCVCKYIFPIYVFIVYVCVHIYIYTALYYIYSLYKLCICVYIMYIYILIDTRLVESLLLAKNSARHGSHLWKAGSQQNWWWIQQEPLGGFLSHGGTPSYHPF